MAVLRLADLDPETVASDAVRTAIERTLALAEGVAPLLRIAGPFHDLPDGVPEEQAVPRSWVYGCPLGLDVRDLVLFAKTGRGLSADKAVQLLTRVNRQLSRSNDGGPQDALQVVALSVVARVIVQSQGAVPSAMLAALGSVDVGVVARLVEGGELTWVPGRGVAHDDALRWLRARHVEGL